MSVTTLDPKTALIVVDLQNGIVAYPCAHPMDGVIERAVTLVEAFRSKGLPVVLVNVTGGAPGRTEHPRPDITFTEDWSKLIDQLHQQPSDILVTKRSWGAFTKTGLEEKLKALGVTQVVVAGVATSIGVEATARYAYENGFNVTLAVDAMTDMRAASHEYSIANVFPRIGETGTAQEILDLLATA